MDGLAKLRGSSLYVDDMAVEGVLHGATIRSHVARGKITGIRFDPSIAWDEYVIVDHRDIPGPNEVVFIEKDQPALAAEEVRHKFEPILLIAHRSPSALRRAKDAITVDIEPLPAVTSPHQSLAPELIQYGTDNVFKKINIEKGDVPSFDNAPHVIEGFYETGLQEHIYLENQGMLAHCENGRLVIHGGMQCPYFVLDAMTHLFSRPAEAFRIVQTEIGGGFGGKEDYPSIIAIHAALLAEKAGRPVKIIYDRQEDMAATTKRHPSRVRHRTAVDNDGRLLGMEIEVILDGGAYVTLSPVVLSRGVIHAAGPYACDYIRIYGEVRLTNTPPNGAFRGFGAPQTLFALERHMDVIAQRIGMEPAELRRRNLLIDGQTTATGQVMKDGVNQADMMDRALELASYKKRREQYRGQNREHPYIRRGIGFSTFYHGAGFTGSGETRLASEVWVQGLPDGRIEVLTANTDMGQGTITVLTQIAADAVNLPLDQVQVAVPDTSRVPNSGPTVASRTAMVVGKLVERACKNLAEQVQGAGPAPLRSRLGLACRVRRADQSPSKGAALQESIRAWHRANPGKELMGRAKYQTPDSVSWDEETYRGDAYTCFSWSTHVADVEVDLRTYVVRVKDYVALQEVGKVLHPVMAAGQIQGGVAQGIGWALLEEVVTADGGMANNQMTNYVIPACSDLPPIRVYFEERASTFGPAGAKGIGELPMDGPAPAVVNAVCNALGTSITSIPVTPERLMAHLEKGVDG
ncbi:MAG: xanthine dehydrogenase family protein molybdopterin-binding subunit [Phycisphaerae bacterium]